MQLQSLGHNLTIFARSIVLGGLFVLPFAFLPAFVAPLASVKSFVLFAVGFVPLLMWAIVSLLKRSIQLSTHPIAVSVGLIVLATGIATLFSSSPSISFVGHGYERDTFAVITAVLVLVLTTSWLFNGVRSLHTLALALLGSFSALGVFTLARLVVGAPTFFPGFFSSENTASLLGSWNDLAVFAGLAVSASLAFLFFYPARRIIHVCVSAVVVLGLLILAIINVGIVWATLAFIVFFLSMYRLSLMSYEYGEQGGTFLPRRSTKAFIIAGIVFACALAFLLFGSYLGARIGAVFNAQYVDVRPSWQGTVAVGSAVYTDDAIFGTGPATFSSVWTEHLDSGVNESLFWDTDFSFGIGMIPTFFITTGIMGGIAWLLLGASWVYGASQFLRTKPQDALVHAVTIIWLTVSGYSLALCTLYVPGTVLLGIMGISLGAFLSALIHMRVTSVRTFIFAQNNVTAFLIPTVLGLLVLASIVLCVEAIRPPIASAYATRASYALSRDDVEHAQTLARRGMFFAQNDDTARVKTNIALALLAQEIQKGTSDNASVDTEKVRTLVQDVVLSAQSVIQFNPRNFRNWLFVAQTYERVSSVVGKDALASAYTAYDQAKKYAPQSPLIPLLRARLAYASTDMDTARTLITEALSLKKNYTDAYYLLSQIEIKENNTQEAIRSTESAVLLAPNNAGLRFQLGFLLYASGKYEDSVRILESAIVLNPDYANALYFLGLAHDRLADSESATKVFAKVLELNPENEEVQAIVDGLAQGVSANETLRTRQGTSPVQRNTLPVSEQSPVIQ